MFRVAESVKPLDDLNVEIQIHYKTSSGVVRPIRTYKPDPGYLAGVPSFLLSVNSSIITIGQLVDVTIDIVVKRMTLNGELYVSYLSVFCIHFPDQFKYSLIILGFTEPRNL